MSDHGPVGQHAEEAGRMCRVTKETGEDTLVVQLPYFGLRRQSMKRDTIRNYNGCDSLKLSMKGREGGSGMGFP